MCCLYIEQLFIRALESFALRTHYRNFCKPKASTRVSAQSGRTGGSGRMQLRSSSRGVNSVQSFNYREERHIDNEQRGSVCKSSLGSDDVRGSKSM